MEDLMSREKKSLGERTEEQTGGGEQKGPEGHHRAFLNATIIIPQEKSGQQLPKCNKLSSVFTFQQQCRTLLSEPSVLLPSMAPC